MTSLNGVTVKAGLPRSLVPANAVYDGSRNSYDVSADGRRFHMISKPADISTSGFTVVLYWTSGLKK